jgi:hypothetical protein
MGSPLGCEFPIVTAVDYDLSRFERPCRQQPPRLFDGWGNSTRTELPNIFQEVDLHTLFCRYAVEEIFTRANSAAYLSNGLVLTVPGCLVIARKRHARNVHIGCIATDGGLG